MTTHKYQTRIGKACPVCSLESKKCTVRSDGTVFCRSENCPAGWKVLTQAKTGFYLYKKVELASHLDRVTTFSLSTAHLNELQASRISKEAARQHGIRTLNNADEIGDLLHWRKPGNAQILGSCLLLPYFDHLGRQTDYVRLKPAKPMIKDGKSTKYLGPKSVSVRVYFPRVANHKYSDPAEPIIITEGEKKALCTALCGFPCLGLGGVSCWSKKRPKDELGKSVGPRVLHEDLQQIPWQDRTVYIAFDSDRSTKPNVLREEKLLAEVLKQAGARVLIVNIPSRLDSSNKQSKQGIDDFLVSNGPDSLQKLLHEAKEIDQAASTSKQLTPCLDDVKNPHYIVDRYQLSRCGPSNQPRTIHYWSGSFFRYCEGAYSEWGDDDIKADVVKYIRHIFVKHAEEQVENKGKSKKDDNGIKTIPVSARLTNDTMLVMRSELNLGQLIKPPAWIGRKASNPQSKHLLVMRNGILDLDKVFTGVENPLSELSPEFFCLHRLSYDFDPTAKAPSRWFEFLHSIWPHDCQAVDALQEWFGYLLTNDTKQQKILFMLGPPRSGKGTINRVLQKLVGEENTCNPSLNSLSGTFGLSQLRDKSVALVTDLRVGYQSNKASICEVLLSISGEDSQTINQKFKAHYTTRLTTRFVLSSNELPTLGDVSNALIKRFILLHLKQTHYGKENMNLEQELIQELPGIFLWALEGWKRLQNRGYFIQPASGKALYRDLERINSPISAFVHEKCFVDASASIDKPTLYAAWKEWCLENGNQHGSDGTFGRNLHAAVPSIDSKRPNQNGYRWNAYTGIRLRENSDPFENEVEESIYPTNSHPSSTFWSGWSGINTKKSSVELEEKKTMPLPQACNEVMGGIIPDHPDLIQVSPGVYEL